MIQSERIVALNSKPVRGRKYVLYWMQAAQRAEYNHALEFAIEKANQRKKPLIVCFCIVDSFPEANKRHYWFMLQGLKDVRDKLEARGIKIVIQHGLPIDQVVEMAEDVDMVVVDAGHLRIQKRWRSEVAKRINCALFEVETNLVVPVGVASEKENFSAGTFRPRITKQLSRYLVPLKHRRPKIDSLGLRFISFPIDDIEKAVSRLNIDRSVDKVDTFHGGTCEAKRRLAGFVRNKLDKFAELRNDPNADCVSNMSSYLHFGQISPLYIALKITKTNSPDKQAYLEELIVRRELSYNFVFFNNNYDTFAALPAWAQRTLNLHRTDKREYVYSRDEFESAKTHDPYWNAAQKEMVLTGKMHGYMRMYWGKKILQWSRSPQAGFKIALYLNNKYALDGRDPNSFTGVAWCFGKHDRPWPERPVFGKIRYMNAAGLKRKFDPDKYVQKIDRLKRNR
jgi:deoxyribodipyrimidine photo-lyase